jgi:hypothetical protein
LTPPHFRRKLDSQFMSTDRTFITNEDGQNLYERFRVLLGNNTKHFDCLIGYFYISGFYKLYPALTQTEKIRILIGIKTDRATFNLIQEGKQQELVLESHAQAKAAAAGAVRDELEKSEDTPDVEEGVRKFVEWIASGKLEIKAYPPGMELFLAGWKSLIWLKMSCGELFKGVAETRMTFLPLQICASSS